MRRRGGRGGEAGRGRDRVPCTVRAQVGARGKGGPGGAGAVLGALAPGSDKQHVWVQWQKP